jgi:hypothetical protein
MKTRKGLVSNSSSSSFVIRKSLLTSDQIYKIMNHIKYWNDVIADLPGHYSCDEDEGWFVDENEEFVSGSTHMDNFSMQNLFDLIEVDDDIVEWTD